MTASFILEGRENVTWLFGKDTTRDKYDAS
jgi:hypothetical protein